MDPPVGPPAAVGSHPDSGAREIARSATDLARTRGVLPVLDCDAEPRGGLGRKCVNIEGDMERCARMKLFSESNLDAQINGKRHYFLCACAHVRWDTFKTSMTSEF